MGHRANVSFYVDWDNDGYFHADVLASDPLNLVPTPVSWDEIDITTAGGTTTVRDESSPYGRKIINHVCSSTSFGGVYFGRDGAAVTDDIPVDASTEYTVTCWIRGVANFSGVTFKLFVRDQTDVVIASQPDSFPLTTDWLRFDFTFTTAVGSTHVNFRAAKSSSSALAEFEVTGWMLVAGSDAPDAFNAGNATNAHDDISAYVMHASWQLGMGRAYQMMADEARCELALNNTSKRFSPEHAAGPLFGSLKPQRAIKIAGENAVLDDLDDGGPILDDLGDGSILLDDIAGDQHFYAGWIDVIQPAMGAHLGPYTCTIVGVGAKQFLEADELNLPLQENVTADEVIATILDDYVQLPPTLIAGDYYELDPCTDVLGFVGDLFKGGRKRRRTIDAKLEGFSSAYDAIQTIVEAERGKFFFNRSGQAVLFSRERFQTDVDTDASFDDTMVSMDYTYGDDLVNVVVVKYYGRSVGASPEALYTLDRALTLAGGQAREIRARFAAADGQVVAGKDLLTPTTGAGTLAFSSGSATLTGFFAEARGATFTLTNASSHKEAVVSTLTVRGTKITAWNVQEIAREDAASVTAYGRRVKVIDGKLFQTAEFADNVAAYELSQKAEPRGMVRSVTFLNRSAALLAHALGRQIGDRIALSETQTAHEGEYWIVGERHRWEDAGQVFETTWVTEPAQDFAPWVLGVSGRSELGETTILGL